MSQPLHMSPKLEENYDICDDQPWDMIMVKNTCNDVWPSDGKHLSWFICMLRLPKPLPWFLDIWHIGQLTVSSCQIKLMFFFVV